VPERKMPYKFLMDFSCGQTIDFSNTVSQGFEFEQKVEIKNAFGIPIFNSHPFLWFIREDVLCNGCRTHGKHSPINRTHTNTCSSVLRDKF